jgi:DNA mismatch repair ATPase MutS
MAKPIFLEDNGESPYIELRQVRHPCVEEQIAKSSLVSKAAPKKFIPNDVVMGTRKG